MTWGGARGGVALVGIALLLVGTVAGLGLLPFAIVPVSTTSTPSFHMNIQVSAHQYNVTTLVHLTLLPQGKMNLTSLTISWGGTPIIYHPPGVSGHYTVSRTYLFALAGTYTIQASGVAQICSSASSPANTCTVYTATSAPAKSTVPGVASSGCIVNCVEVSSAYTVTTNGLSATFTDQSQAFNATSTSVAWTFGDGTFGAGTSATHTYPAAGVYPTAETVTATNITGATATSTSFQNVTITIGVTGCQGTGSCSTPPPPFLTPTSGIFLGAGAGVLGAIALWGRPELSVLVAASGTVIGFIAGLAATGML